MDSTSKMFLKDGMNRLLNIRTMISESEFKEVKNIKHKFEQVSKLRDNFINILSSSFEYDYDPMLQGGYTLSRQDYINSIDSFIYSYKEIHVANYEADAFILNTHTVFLYVIKLLIDVSKRVLLRRLLIISLLNTTKDITFSYNDFYMCFDENIKLMFEYLTESLNKLNIKGLSFDNDMLFSMSEFVTDFKYTKDATHDELLNFFENTVLALKPHFNVMTNQCGTFDYSNEYKALSLLRKDFANYKRTPSISRGIEVAESIRKFFPLCFNIRQDDSIKHIFRFYGIKYYQDTSFKWRRVRQNALSIFQHFGLLAMQGGFDAIELPR